MKIPLRSVSALLLAAWVGASAQAIETYRLETHLYVFKAGGKSISSPDAAIEATDQGMVLQAPTTLTIGSETLALNGAEFVWRGDDNPPPGFSLIATPVMVLKAGDPATLLSAAPVQYPEPSGDGALHLRTVAADTAGAPHCKLTFIVTAPKAPDAAPSFSCDLDIATVSSREKLPGVELDVGRPVLTRFVGQLGAGVRLGDWSALLLRSPNGSDYGLLVLFRVDRTADAHPVE